jgi:hypothetical protein
LRVSPINKPAKNPVAMPTDMTLRAAALAVPVTVMPMGGHALKPPVV